MPRVLLTLMFLVISPLVVNAQDLFLTNGRFVDPEKREIREGNLLIKGGVIAGSPDSVGEKFAGETIDLGGKWVIPGLHDLHVHSFGNQAPGGKFEAAGTPVIAKRMLYAGVTGFLDLFHGELLILPLRDLQRSEGLAGADIFAAGPCLTAKEGHCSEYGVPTRLINTPEEAREQITELAAKHPDVVKIVYQPSGRMPSIDKETLTAAIVTASEHGLSTVIHIGTWDELSDAVKAGATAVTHTPPGNLPDDIVDLLVESGTYVIPTMVVHSDIVAFINDPSVLADPLASAVTTKSILGAYDLNTLDERAKSYVERASVRAEKTLSSVKMLSDSGVRILTGTDSGNWGTIHGFSIHRELKLLVDAGLSPWDALAASTTVAGAFLGRSFGVGEGDEGSLVVLEASPIDDIENTREISIVIHHGVVIDRDGLLK